MCRCVWCDIAVSPQHIKRIARGGGGGLLFVSFNVEKNGLLAIRHTNPTTVQVARAVRGFLALRRTNPITARVFNFETNESEQCTGL